ncbi:unnamed protein product [Rotaria sp. Silwood2]|nr:unnamed protein product [Rotaria sp. Silwood2]
MHLHQNMRTEPGEEEFSNWLIKLGNGELTSNEDDEIELPSSYKMYTSVDEVECEDGDDITNYPTEFLNSLTPSGMPPHKLKLNIGAIVMLLRNLDVHQGLCNGIWLIVRRLLNHTIDCEIATGSIKASRVLIPRITLTPSDPFLPFKLHISSIHFNENSLFLGVTKYGECPIQPLLPQGLISMGLIGSICSIAAPILILIPEEDLLINKLKPVDINILI